MIRIINYILLGVGCIVLLLGVVGITYPFLNKLLDRYLDLVTKWDKYVQRFINKHKKVPF
jgi:uncharacterized membrane protein YbaN (DUF454 family)